MRPIRYDAISAILRQTKDLDLTCVTFFFYCGIYKNFRETSSGIFSCFDNNNRIDLAM